MSERRVALRITGRVQGVGFRWFVQQAARREQLAGWVRNEPDGAVRLEAAGDEAAVERFVAAVRSGPPTARVERVEDLEASASPLPTPFAVDR